MATAHILEIGKIGSGDVDGWIQPMPIAQMPPIAEQTVTYTSATQSAAFNADTRAVRIDGAAERFVAFGSNPTATAASIRLKAGEWEWFGVDPGDKVSIYDGTT